MIFKNIDGSINVVSGEVVHQSTYDKVTITYPIEKPIYETKMEKKEEKVVDADGVPHILRTYEVEVPVMETKLVKEKVSKINPDTNEEIFEEVKKEITEPKIKEVVREEVRYNKYDAMGVIIIPDDAVILSDEEYAKEIEKMRPGYVDEAKLAQKYAYIVNITTEKRKKVATIVKPDGVVELDFDRGDLGTDDYGVAEKYAYIVNNEGLAVAVAWAKENGFVK